MKRRLSDLLIRFILAFALACSPLAQPLAIAALAAPTSAPAAACPHHAKSAQAKPGECCAHPGHACHCAMAAALPTAALPMPAAVPAGHPESVPQLNAALSPAPEPPPPRA